MSYGPRSDSERKSFTSASSSRASSAVRPRAIRRSSSSAEVCMPARARSSLDSSSDNGVPSPPFPELPMPIPSEVATTKARTGTRAAAAAKTATPSPRASASIRSSLPMDGSGGESGSGAVITANACTRGWQTGARRTRVADGRATTTAMTKSISKRCTTLGFFEAKVTRGG